MAVALAACGTDAVATSSPPAAATQPPPSVQPKRVTDPAARDAYGAAICPIFVTIIEVDPRVAELRDLGESGEPIGPHRDEIAAVSDDLRATLIDLAGVPDWEPGRLLVFRLRESLQAMRLQLLLAEREAASIVAARALAAIPHGANDAVEAAMAQAVAGGLSCGAPE